MLQDAVDVLVKGMTVNNFRLYARAVFEGRFREEKNVDVWVKHNDDGANLLYVKAFSGRKPDYRPWVELFNINDSVYISNESISYFDSIIEDQILSFFAGYLEPGAKIFVEYYDDPETRKQLELGLPPCVTRLGYKLYNLGFTWFKDWYFPEGFMEGNQKLQGEKPLNDESKKRQVITIYNEVKNFYERFSATAYESHIKEAVKKAKGILNTLDETCSHAEITRKYK